MRLLSRSPRAVSAPLAALAGVLAAAVGLAAGELVAGLARSLASPVISIGNRFVDAVPRPVKDFAIETFGTNDKLVLVGGILVVLAVLAALLGVLARHRPPLAAALTALLGVIGVVAASAEPGASLPLAVLPSVATLLVSVPLLLVLVRPSLVGGAATPAEPGTTDRTPTDRTPAPARAGIDRRRFLALAGTSTLAGLAAAGGGRLLAGRFDVAAERAELALPTPGETAPPIPAGAHPDIEGLSSFLTDNADFYRIDTALQVPNLSAEGWTLRVHGMVDEERTFTYQELLDMPSVELPITMTCVSNEVGGGLVGTARWQGVRLRDLLDRVGVADDADQVVGRAFDGFTTGFPVPAAYDREALVVYAMNGEPLPPVHGFPLRMVVPGLYGYVSATKWMSEIELTRFDQFDQYWVERDWDARAPIKVQSRIDTPGGFARVPVGTAVPVAGVAWAQTRGITRVEVRVDDGDWQEAELAEPVNDVTWRQWVYRWDTSGREPGSRAQLTVRATDDEGTTQAEERVPPFPNGAEGWHSVAVFLEDAPAG